MKKLLFVCAVAAYAFVAMGTLIDVLKAVHGSAAFSNLSAADQVMIVELVAETEAGELKTYIDTVGLHNVLDLVDRLPAPESHLFLRYLKEELAIEEHVNGTQPVLGKRNLVGLLTNVKSNAAFQHLSTADQNLIIEVLTAAENHQLTDKVNELGYSTILRIVDILPENEKHMLDAYLIEHLRMESHQKPIAG